MDLETIDQPSPLPCPPPRSFPVPSAGCLGLLAGLAVAYVATEVLFRHDGEAGGLFFCFFSPFLAVAGVCIGKAAEAYGWASVRPAAWALLLVAFLGPDTPTAGIVAGAAGGAFSGVLLRSWAATLRGALRGAVLGLASWAAAWEYWRLLMAAN